MTGAGKRTSDEEENYRLYFENSLDTIFLANPNGEIYKWNPAALKLFGYTNEEFCSIGRQQIQDYSNPHFQEALIQREKTGEYSGVLTFIKKDGTKFQAAVQSKLYKLKDGSIRTFTSIRDITLLKESEEKAAFQSLIVDNVSDAIFTFDENTVVTSWSKSAERLYGWTAEEMIGKNSAKIVKSSTTPEVREEIFRQIDLTGDALIEITTNVASEIVIFNKTEVSNEVNKDSLQ